MKNPTSTWSATENRIVEPYLRSSGALRDVKFRLSPEAGFTDDEAYWVEYGEVPDPFLPEFQFEVDEKALRDESHLSTDDLRLVVVVRDRAVRRWELMNAYPIDQVPSALALPSERLQRFAIARRLEFAALVVPRYGLPPTVGRAHLPQHVVAERSFQVNLRREGTRFPVRVREEEWFVSQEYPATTVWTIDWQTRDPMVPPAEALHIVVNEKYAIEFQAALGTFEKEAALGHQIAAEVFAEVALVALRAADEWPSDPESLLGTVLGGLGVKNVAEMEHYTNMVADPTDAIPRLRGYAQAALGLGTAMGRG